MNFIGRMNRFVALRSAALVLLGTVAASPAFADTTFGPNAQGDIAIPVGMAATRAGKWTVAIDPTAAGGKSIRHPDQKLAKVDSPLASPANYFELKFNAQAGKPYRLWVHGRADSNHWGNDSVFVQFSGSVTSSGAAKYRIGTTSGAEVNLEDCSSCGLSDWMWQDNGYGSNVLGPAIYFAASGQQTIRVQTREDGIAIDQIVLSPQVYLKAQPVETLTPAPVDALVPAPVASISAPEIVLTAATATKRVGKWAVSSDATAQGGAVIRHADSGAAKVTTAVASPANYFELTFNAEAGKPYRLWVHGRADSNYWANDSVFVQFSGSVTSTGAATYRIGTTSAAEVNLEECKDCGLTGWTWQDNGYGAGVLGPTIRFAASGTQTIRVQTREDGLAIDQILLSAAQFLTAPPAAATPPPPPPPPPPAPAPAPAPSGAVRMRVLQWNLHHGTDASGKYDLVRLATWMATMKPDIIMLNEVEKYTYWGNEDQPARYEALVEGLTGRNWYRHFSQEYGNWSANGKGHLILSTYPLQWTANELITGTRTIGAAGITVNGRSISLIVTHLDPYSHSVRLAQAKEVMTWTSSIADNRILTGDMNAWPDQTSIAELNKGYRDSWTDATAKGTAFAFSGLAPDGATKNGRIDYIFYSRTSSNLVVIDSRVYDTRNSSGVMASDHRPVVTTFEVR
jgi:endonuclease/exonuclease/phosphatase family metal-dependent hydrolase